MKAQGEGCGRMKVFGGFVALFYLLALRATLVTTELLHAPPRKLGDITILDSAPEEAEESSKIDTAPEVEEAKKIKDVSLKENDKFPAHIPCSTCVKIEGTCYNRSYLFNLTAPFANTVVIKKMGILWSQNVLYYSFEPPFEDHETFKVAYVRLDSSTSGRTHIITGNFNFSVFDINQRENLIYLGGSDGIWSLKYHFKATPVPHFYAAKHEKITNVISKDYVYFSKQNSLGIIKLKNGVYVFILEDNTIDNFVLDRNVEYNVVYLNGTGLYAFNSKTMDEVMLSDYHLYRGLTVDILGVVYAWNPNGIYRVYFNEVYSHSNLTKVSDDDVGAMTFDRSNNIIYSKEKSLYKLTNLHTTKC